MPNPDHCQHGRTPSWCPICAKESPGLPDWFKDIPVLHPNPGITRPTTTPKENAMCDAQREMPRYQCHKKVWALKIKSISFDRDVAKKEGRETDGSATITPADLGFAQFKVDFDFVVKHKPQAGGYYVVYEDGYKSFSPAEAFESGYTLIK